MMCPLPTAPPHSHELLTSKKNVAYVRCHVFQSHLYFRSDLAKQWLSEHMENGGSLPIENPIEVDEPRTIAEHDAAQRRGRRIRANPDEEPIAEESTASAPRRVWPCPKCGAAIPEDAPQCPGCGEETVWENPAAPAGALQRTGRRVESDVQRVLEKMRREVEGGE